ncbi:MAG: hypothetical protein MZW92_38850 [Comamonadaceae bacterium]|nr:hypothetical protein [Comamonadaceae bacterium]
MQRAGLAAERTVELLGRLAVHGKLPGTAHRAPDAGGITTGESRHRP